METNPGLYTTNQGQTATDAGGKVFVTKIDLVKNTISGTFQFNMFRDLDNGKKTVIDGVFEDLPFGAAGGGSGTGGSGTGGGTGGGNGGGGTGGSVASISAKIGTLTFNATTTSGLSAGGKIVISGEDSLRNLTVQMPDNVKAGTYNISLTANYGGIYLKDITAPSPANTFMGESGKIVIIEHDTAKKKIRGTFEFTAKPMNGGSNVAITAGAFNIEYE
jgi:hypothetical protein